MPVSEFNLSDILGALADKEIKKVRNKALPEAQICTLREVKDRYLAGNSFKVGDIITPRKGGAYNGRGVPHMVIEVAQTPLRNLNGSTASSDFGSRLDIRVIRVDGEHVVPFWMESFQLEQWNPQTQGGVN